MIQSMLKVYNHSCEQMPEVQDGTVGLIVTSPPYNVSLGYKGYGDNLSLKQYLAFIERVLTECYRVLDFGGRLVINIANTGRQPYIPLTSYFDIIANKIGFGHCGYIIWDKGASAAQRTSWGSFASASAPGLRDVNEFILVYAKGFKGRRMKGTSTITNLEFMEYTESIWRFNTESAQSIGHPAPYPLELPTRAIKLFSYLEDLVIDPFCGSGTTALAAFNLGRRFIGYEIQKDYIELAESRLREAGCSYDLTGVNDGKE